MRVACYDRLLAHFLPGDVLSVIWEQGGSDSLEHTGVDHNINNILQLKDYLLLSRACDRWSQCDAYLEYLESSFRVHLSDKVQSLPHHCLVIMLSLQRAALCIFRSVQDVVSPVSVSRLLQSLHCDPWGWHLTWGDDIWHLMSPSLSHSLIINCHAHWHTCRANQEKQAGYRFTNIHL